MHKLKILWYTLADWLERQKGVRSFKYIKTYNSSDVTYKVITSGSFEISIYCTESVYGVQYSKMWARDKVISIYNVYCTLSGDVPKTIRERLSGELKMAAILHPWSSKESQRKAVIHAYIDLILNEIKH